MLSETHGIHKRCDTSPHDPKLPKQLSVLKVASKQLSVRLSCGAVKEASQQCLPQKLSVKEENEGHKILCLAQRGNSLYPQYMLNSEGNNSKAKTAHRRFPTCTYCHMSQHKLLICPIKGKCKKLEHQTSSIFLRVRPAHSSYLHNHSPSC